MNMQDDAAKHSLKPTNRSFVTQDVNNHSNERELPGSIGWNCGMAASQRPNMVPNEPT